MAKVEVSDLSGTPLPVTSNPYNAILEACKYDPRQIQERYQQHRVARNAQQRQKILGSDFAGWVLDDYLIKLDGELRDPNFVDPRNCLVFWARPPQKVKDLITTVQQKLRAVAPDIWLMAPDKLHMTAMEITHSLTAPEIDVLVDRLKPVCHDIADVKPDRCARLVKPMLSYDAAAVALSFVPAAGESLPSNRDRTTEDDKYTYHEYRRDLYAAISNSGVSVASRYVVPSAHLTVARFNSANVFGGGEASHDVDAGRRVEKRQRWIRGIELINEWLEREFWPKDDKSDINGGGEWILGNEKGLDFRKGTLWYGGGETIYLGKSIEANRLAN